MAVQTQIGMPMEDFIRQYEQAPFELVNGEKVLLVPPVAEHGEVIRILLRALFGYEQINPNFVVYTEMPVVLEDTPGWVKGSRVPDLMIYEKSRLEEYKARTPDSITRLTEADALDGGAVLPGFSLAVRALFAN